MSEVKVERRAISPAILAWFRCILVFGALLIALFLLDAALFRSGLYALYSSPESASGEVQLAITFVRAQHHSEPHRILVLGDSQTAEGLSERLANAILQPAGFSMTNGSMSGNTLRDRYYVLRDIDPLGRRFNIIAIPLRDYADLGRFENIADRIIDLNWVVTFLRVGDIVPFAESFDDPALRREALLEATFKGLIYRPDIRDFLTDPLKRIRMVNAYRRDAASWWGAYDGNDGSLAGLTRNPQTGEVKFAPGISPELQDMVRTFLDVNQLTVFPAERRYRKKWMRMIMSLYAKTSAKFVIFRVPCYPIHVTPPEPNPPDPNSFVSRLRGNPRVLILDEHLFDDLESPENFFDGEHLNKIGRAKFSVRFAQAMLGSGLR